MLREVVLPELENGPLYDITDIIWQQDGAPLHYSLRVREFLNNNFPVWIGRCGTVHCPPPPPTYYITPCDSSVWGIMNEVFSQSPMDLKHLRTINDAQFENMDGDKNVCTTIVNSVAERCRSCIEQNGNHFEQFCNTILKRCFFISGFWSTLYLVTNLDLERGCLKKNLTHTPSF
jgi:hypothetical protein